MQGTGDLDNQDAGDFVVGDSCGGTSEELSGFVDGSVDEGWWYMAEGNVRLVQFVISKRWG